MKQLHLNICYIYLYITFQRTIAKATEEAVLVSWSLSRTLRGFHPSSVSIRRITARLSDLIRWCDPPFASWWTFWRLSRTGILYRPRRVRVTYRTLAIAVSCIGRLGIYRNRDMCFLTFSSLLIFCRLRLDRNCLFATLVRSSTSRRRRKSPSPARIFWVNSWRFQAMSDLEIWACLAFVTIARQSFQL